MVRELLKRHELQSAADGEEPGASTQKSLRPLLKGVLAWGRVRAERDFFNAVSIHVRIADRSVDSTATLKLYASDDSGLVRESRRRTLTYDTDSWVLFVFDSICESESREYLFSIETDAEHEAIEVWEASSGGVECRTHYFKSLANLFDPLLARRGQLLPDIPDYLERYLDRHVYQCVNLRRYFFARLLHLADAIGRVAEPITDALAIGVGVGYQEAFLAGRFPYMQVLATDLEKQIVDFPMPNLKFETLDLLDPPGSERFDFVFSIECLEHIEDYETAFRHKSAMVRPGGYLYVSVPFASREEQRDQDLRKQAWEENEHYTPGFAFEDLEQLFAANNLEVLHAANMFHLEVMLPLRHIIDRISSAELEAGVEEIAQLYMLDLKDQRVESYKQAEGIRFLGRKRSC